MHEGRHDFMARAGDQIAVIKEVPALICDTCGEVEYTLETSREIDAIMKDFFAGKLLAKPLAAGRSHLRPNAQTRLYENVLPINACKRTILQRSILCFEFAGCVY